MSDVLSLTPTVEVEHLSANQLDALITALVERRSRMRPGPSAIPPTDPGLMLQADNLLWEVRPAASGRAAELALYHPGLGWAGISLSRAQIEDMADAFAFALNELPVRLNPAVG